MHSTDPLRIVPTDSENVRAMTGEIPETGRSPTMEPEGTVLFGSRLAEILKHRSTFRRARLIESIANDLNASEIRQAIAELETTPIREKNDILVKLLARWGELDPQEALEFARRLPQRPGYDAMNAVVGNWMLKDPEKAEKWIAQLPNGLLRKVAWSGVIQKLSERDPKRAFMIAEKTGNRYEFASLFEQWGKQDPEQAATHAVLVPAGFWRDLALEAAAREWAKKDLQGALAWAQSLPSDNGLPTSIERRDPKPLAVVMQAWLADDADAALQWLQNSPDDAAKSDVLAALSASLADSDPARAVELAAMLPAGNAQDRTLRRLINDWSSRDLSGALAWAQEQTNEQVRRVLLPTLVQKLSVSDSENALRLALTIGGIDGQSAVQGVLLSWAGKDPESAAAWVESQPRNAEYSASVAVAWARHDPAGAAQWIAKMPAGQERDQALSTAASRLVWGHPEVAVQWVAGIRDKQKRTSAYQRVVSEWFRIDPKVTRAWIQEASLPTDLKNQLLQLQQK